MGALGLPSRPGLCPSGAPAVLPLPVPAPRGRVAALPALCPHGCHDLCDAASAGDTEHLPPTPPQRSTAVISGERSVAVPPGVQPYPACIFLADPPGRRWCESGTVT